MFTRPLLLLVLVMAAATLCGCCDIGAEFGVSVSGTCEQPLQRDAYICPGENVTLCWATTKADSVSIDGIGGVNLSGKTSVAPSTTQNYVLTAKNSDCDTSRTVTVHVIKPGTEVILDASPYAPGEDWRAVIVPDQATAKVKVTSLEPRCTSNCFMPQVQKDPQNPYVMVPDTSVHYADCGYLCATWWNGTKQNVDGSLYTPITVRGQRINIPYVPLAGTWIFHYGDKNIWKASWGDAIFTATATCEVR
jgi:hypothetical protein